MQPAMHLYITRALYFEIYIPSLEGIHLMSIIGYEAFVCVCFFAYKTLCATLHMASVGCLKSPVCVFILVEKSFHKFQEGTGARTKNILINEQKVGMLLQKRADTRGVGISNWKFIYLLTTTSTNHTHRFHPLPPATSASC